MSRQQVTLDRAVVQRWRDARDLLGLAKAMAEQAEREVLALLDGAEIGTVRGEPAVRRETEMRTGIDLERLHSERPELWDQYPKARSRVRLRPMRNPRCSA